MTTKPLPFERVRALTEQARQTMLGYSDPRTGMFECRVLEMVALLEELLERRIAEQNGQPPQRAA